MVVLEHPVGCDPSKWTEFTSSSSPTVDDQPGLLVRLAHGGRARVLAVLHTSARQRPAAGTRREVGQLGEQHLVATRTRRNTSTYAANR